MRPSSIRDANGGRSRASAAPAASARFTTSNGGGSGTGAGGRATSTSVATSLPRGSQAGGQVYEHGHDLPSNSNPAASNDTIPIGEQLMQVDQAITLTLQEIDANFAKTHQTITGKILPSIKRYGIASHSTWQGAQFWHRFFEAASDINLAPTRDDQGGEEEGQEIDRDVSEEGRSYSYDTEQESALDQSELSYDSRDGRGGEYSLGDDSNGSGFEPPRVSDASMAASARLARGTGERQDHRYEINGGEEDSFDSQGSETGKLAQALGNLDMNSRRQHPSMTPRRHTGQSRLATNVLRAQHEQSAKKSGALRVQATPRKGSRINNPFAEEAGNDSLGANDGNAASSSSSPRWSGIADLRKTPLKAANKSRPVARKDAGPSRGGAAPRGKDDRRSKNEDFEGDDSLAWPPGMSPPVTMQFSVPRSRFNKTPAKEAARMVVDDLLRTVEGATPAARRRLVREHELAQGKSRPNQERLSSRPAGMPGTPLGSGKGKRAKGRRSMPTPPTITKREGGITRNLAHNQRESTPKVSQHDGNAATSSARLLDQDEGGESLMEGMSLGNKRTDSTLDLATGLDRLGQGHGGSLFEDLMDASQPNDDDDSDNDLDDDSDSEDEPIMPGFLSGSQAIRSSPSRANLPPSQQKGGQAIDRRFGQANNSITSVSHSIDEDTLFGIRDPSLSVASGTSGKNRMKAGTGGGMTTSKVAGSSSRHHETPNDYRSKGHANSPSKKSAADRGAKLSSSSTTGLKETATPSTAQKFKPMGHVAGLGTVHRGRPLLGEERDDTYSAPSPTPATTYGSSRRTPQS